MTDGTTAPKPHLDDQDRAILNALLDDCRASHRDIAQTTGIPPTTVNRRIRHMEAEGVIRAYRPILDPEALGWGLSVIVGLRIDKGHLRSVQKAISSDPRIHAVYDVTGEWDGVVLARVRDRADLDDLAKGPLSHQHIQRTNTMVVLSTVHEEAVVRAPPT